MGRTLARKVMSEIARRMGRLPITYIEQCQYNTKKSILPNAKITTVDLSFLGFLLYNTNIIIRWQIHQNNQLTLSLNP